LNQCFYAVNQWVLLQRFEPVSAHCKRVLIGATNCHWKSLWILKKKLQNFGLALASV